MDTTSRSDAPPRRLRRDGQTLLQARPELAKQWDPDNAFGPDQVKRTSPEAVKWICACGHRFEKAVYHRVRAKGKSMGCPKCAKNDRVTLTIKTGSLAERDPDLASQWSDKNPLSPAEVGFKSGKEAHWVCPRGHEFLASPAHRTASASGARGCPRCYEEMLAEGAQRGRARLWGLKPGAQSIAEASPDLVEQWGPLNHCTPQDVAATSYTEYHWICPNGHEFWESAVTRTYAQTPSRGCRECYRNDRHEAFVTPENSFAARQPHMAQRWSPKNPKPPTAYAAMSRRVVIFDCPKGHEYTARVEAASLGRGCPVCSKRTYKHTRRTPFATARPSLVPEWSDRNTAPADAVGYGSQELVWWKCQRVPSHPEWQSTPHNRADGHGRCPTCNPANRSYAETELFDALTGLGLTGVRGDRSLIGPFELDMYFPERRLAVEFNGLYGHQAEQKGDNYHYEKSQLCRRQGVGLIQVWEDDWRERREVVMRAILTKLSHLDVAASVDSRYVAAARRVSSRECAVTALARDEAFSFLDTHHIQGPKAGSIRLGLRDADGSLVAVLTASVSGERCLVERFATSCIVRGGFSRLESALTRAVPGTVRRLVTFADLSVSDGGLYERCGWTRDAELGPDYAYISNKQRVHKFNYRLKRFRSDPDLRFVDGLTERELADLNNIPRVYDAGKIRYIKEVRR